MALTNIAIAGGTGNLGPSIINALLKSGFQVTALSRSSSHQLDPRVQIKAVDYSSKDSLVAALKGQDALINTLGVGQIPVDVHLRLVDAALVAGVRRYLPSEFGSDTANPLTSKLPVFGDKIAVVKRLNELTSQHTDFSYTALITGPFFDWGLQQKFLLNLAGPTTSIFDGGDVPFSTTTLAGIGRAVVGVLKHPAETNNRHVYVAEAEVTQNQILQLSGRAEQLQLEQLTTDDLERKAYEAVKQPTPDFRLFAVNLIRRSVFGGDRYGGRFAKVDNELLGVDKLSDAQIREIVKRSI
ncbi:oxidoreductase CipA [Penicillium capsulatum]|uniref:Oxidoreductase CipA n=1 Tax=Penicillium capsulatum TaxID=69766 RepID=A0A9W9M0I3_9EURO|nr:oxidoreductase CipA [Penicillium capsulatum]KAJ6129272.1 oxidoreductase CipA [Penicillium capsulatum]